MQRVSTNLTLFFKFFIPIFWVVLFGAIWIALLLNPKEYYADMHGPTLRWGVTLFYLSGVAMFYFTLFRLKRVEMDEYFVYVTDYFRAARYPWHQVADLHESRFLFFQVVSIELKTQGIFGKRVFFIASNQLYRDFWQTHPELRVR